MKLMIQPGSGIAPLVKGIQQARSAVQIMIFRFDRREIEKALVAAANRGVAVHALIAYTNRGGEKSLRDLEMRLLAAGVTVSRTAGDLVRYHAKLIIIDKRELYVLGFNFAFRDIERSRSFGVITTRAKFVREAVKLFEADAKRQSYEPGCSCFVVSPNNARQQMAAFIEGAKHELLIYDPKISDPQMIRLLEARAAAGVKIRILGRLMRPTGQILVRKLTQIRLHTRSMIRDRKLIFIGSQSLRTAELDARREVGVIFSESVLASQILKVFEGDWTALEGVDQSAANQDGAPTAIASTKVAKKIAKAVTKKLLPVGTALSEIVRNAVGAEAAEQIDIAELEQTVKESVAQAVKTMVVGSVDKSAAQKSEEEANVVA